MNRNNGSRIFLTELMFSILFFIVIASGCVQCFAQGYLMTKEADELTQAVSLASNAVEKFYGDDNFSDFEDFYNSDWQKTSEEEAEYSVTGVVEAGESKYSYEQNMTVTVTKLSDDSEVYSLEVEKGAGLED